MNHPRKIRLLPALTLILVCVSAQAGWQDMLKSAGDLVKQPSSTAPSAGTPSKTGSATQGEAGEGLQQALVTGVRRVVDQLGARDGYLGNPQVRIPLPSQLKTVESGLRLVGQSAYADRFIETMNRAAEQAVGEATPIFVNAITSMTFDDALGVLQGPPDAATQYLRRSSGPALRERMLPIVQSATESTQVTAAYKTLVDKAAAANPLGGNLMGMDAADLDGYVTDRALDGLYKLLAEQEQAIRSSPAEWTTDIMKKVFGGLGG